MTKDEKLLVIKNLRKERDLLDSTDLSIKISNCISDIKTLAILFNNQNDAETCAILVTKLNLYFGLSKSKLALLVMNRVFEKESLSIMDTIDIIIDSIESLVLAQDMEC